MKYLQSKMLDERTKGLVEEGILDSNLELTEKGYRIVVSILVLKDDTVKAELDAYVERQKELRSNKA